MIKTKIMKFLSVLFISITFIFSASTVGFALDNVPHGDIGDFGNWVTQDNVQKITENLTEDLTTFQQNFEETVHNPGFIPIEVKIGLAFMKALGYIDELLQSSLVRFTIIFLLIMYMFWIFIETYKQIREAGDMPKLLEEIFKKGIIISIWIIVLNYGPLKIFTLVMDPIISLGTYLSNFILDTVSKQYNIDINDTCAAIHSYVNSNISPNGKLMIDKTTAANIMCLPGRLSTYFYHAVSAGFKWMLYGFGHSATAVLVGGISIFIFITCILKYAFMTLGVVADLCLRLLMLPFTALAEAMPDSSDKSILGQILKGFLGMFNTKKISDLFGAFVNSAVYFVSLSIIVSICAALLENIIKAGPNGVYSNASAMTTLLTGCFVLYLANKADELATQLGGKIDNSFGTKLQSETKTLWSDTKKLGGQIFKEWLKK